MRNNLENCIFSKNFVSKESDEFLKKKNYFNETMKILIKHKRKMNNQKFQKKINFCQKFVTQKILKICKKNILMKRRKFE